MTAKGLAARAKSERIGGLTKDQRKRIFALQEKLRDENLNFYMRINDTTLRSIQSRTRSAKKMAELCAAIYRTVKP